MILTLQSTCAVTSVKEEQLANFSLFLTKAMMSFPSTSRNCFLVPFSPEMTNLNPSAQFWPLVRTWSCSTTYKCIPSTDPLLYLANINPLAPFPHISSGTGLPIPIPIPIPIPAKYHTTQSWHGLYQCLFLFLLLR